MAQAQTTAVRIAHFSDVLCVWAYIAQIRLDALKEAFGAQIALDYHFLPVFGVVEQRIGEGWKARGGYAGYGRHVREVAAGFDHVEVHPQIWQGEPPRSSANAHLFLKAVQLLASAGGIDNHPDPARSGRTLFEEVTWRLRLAFFRDGRDITTLDTQLEMAGELGLPGQDILALLRRGDAMAALCRDSELCREYTVGGSPSYVLNGGRQRLYGNVGFKVIAANVHELLHQPGTGQASWC